MSWKYKIVNFFLKHLNVNDRKKLFDSSLENKKIAWNLLCFLGSRIRHDVPDQAKAQHQQFMQNMTARQKYNFIHSVLLLLADTNYMPNRREELVNNARRFFRALQSDEPELFKLLPNEQREQFEAFKKTW